MVQYMDQIVSIFGNTGPSQLTHNFNYNVASNGHLGCGNVVSYTTSVHTTLLKCCVIAQLTHNVTTPLHLGVV